jgi:hypothetical protein
MGRKLLVLWRINEAYDSLGQILTRSLGSQMQGVAAGDRLFICASERSELYLLGAIEVQRTQTIRANQLRREYGRYQAAGFSVFGPFQMLPLRARKWRIRFNSPADRLKRTATIGYQLQKHRELAEESAKMLASLLRTKRQSFRNNMQLEKVAFKKEGRQLAAGGSTRERDPKLRMAALQRYGYACKICGFRFEKHFGDFKDCIEIHHLDPVGLRKTPSRTELDRVVPLCPNCHRVIHRNENPSDWKAIAEAYR